jgi:hypothetical protein
MKEIGIVTLLSVAVTAAAPGPQAYRPAVYVTPKTTQDFATCFTRSQDERGAAWWFVPREHGGTISNHGNTAQAATYFIVIKDLGTRREIALDGRSANNAASEALNGCI